MARQFIVNNTLTIWKGTFGAVFCYLWTLTLPNVKKNGIKSCVEIHDSQVYLIFNWSGSNVYLTLPQKSCSSFSQNDVDFLWEKINHFYFLSTEVSRFASHWEIIRTLYMKYMKRGKTFLGRNSITYSQLLQYSLFKLR